MDAPQLRDEAVRDRIRAAEEFLDPSECFKYFIIASTYDLQTMCVHAVIEQISFSCLTAGYGDFLLVNKRQPYSTCLTRNDQVSLDEVRSHDKELADGYDLHRVIQME